MAKDRGKRFLFTTVGKGKLQNMKISGIVLAHNEEELLSKALSSLSFCAEIIVVLNAADTKTAQIAKMQASGFVKMNSNNFSTLRNAGLEKAKGDWVFYLDADEQVS